MTVQELKDAEELDYKDNTFYKQLRQFVLDGLVGQGAKDGKSNTYYITEKGISDLEECHEE
jgi:predicted transcriptional regulator